jgi:cytoskeletal protein CcmA (bactofilin family)
LGRLHRRAAERTCWKATSADEIPSISSSITIVGKISGTGTISGRIEGELHASTVLIDDGAQVEGDIVAEELIIGGAFCLVVAF